MIPMKRDPNYFTFFHHHYCYYYIERKSGYIHWTNRERHFVFQFFQILMKKNSIA
jgi:hypothetical protein